MKKQRFRALGSILAATILAATVLGGGVPQNVEAAPPPGIPNLPVQTFATLPLDLPGNPEGMTTDAAGNIYVASFNTGLACPDAAGLSDAARTGIRNLMGARGGDRAGTQAIPPGTPNFIYVYSPSGALIAQTPFVACAAAPLGMHVIGNQLFVINVFNGTVYRYNLPLTNTSTPDRSYVICGGFLAAYGAGSSDPNNFGFCALNDMKAGPDGRLYMSDNGAGPGVIGFPPGFLTGRVFVLDPVSGAASIFLLDPGLNVFGQPEFGVVANVFSPDGKTLYLANFSTDFIYSVQVSPQNPNQAPSLSNPLVPPTGPLNIVFQDATVINGPNHMAFDSAGRLWVTGGQNNTVVALQATPNGRSRAVVSAGSFCGFTPAGAPACLLQPANVVFANGQMYVGNEANVGLSPQNTDLPPTDPQWTTTLKLWTVARFTPPPGASGGRSFGATSNGQRVLLSWAGGATQTGYLIARLANNVFTILPNTGPLPANTTSFADTTPIGGIDCYWLFPVRPGGGVFSSDLLCASIGIQGGTAPRNFTIQLDQGFQATLSWAPPAGGGQTGYQLVSVGGGIQPLGPAERVATVPINGFQCFLIQALQGNTVMGTSEVVCANTGFANLP